jgi:hypothetical protein
MMTRFATVLIGCIGVAGCAQSPPPAAHGNSLPPCRVTIAVDGGSWYVLIDRAPEDPAFASGSFVAEIVVFVTDNAGTRTERMTAGPTQARIQIRSSSPITGAAPSSCEAFEPR